MTHVAPSLRPLILPGEFRFVTLPRLRAGGMLPELKSLRTSKFFDSTAGRETVDLFDCDEWFFGRAPVGLAPAACEALRRAGHRSEFVDRTNRPLPPRNRGAVSRRGIRDGALLEFVVRGDRPCGLIRYADGAVDPAWIIAQIAIEWPKTKILVIAGNDANVVRLAHCLQRFAPVGYVSSRRIGGFADRVMVTTPFPSHEQGEILLRDVVIVLNGREAAGEHLSLVLRQPMRARVFGLQPLGEKLSPYEQDMVTASFGFDRLTIRRHGRRERPVTMVQIGVQGGDRAPFNLSGRELKSRAMWKHRVRNALICRVARAIEARDEADLQRLVRWYGWEDLRSRRILLLVENVEHALHLHRKLPDWAVLTGEYVDVTGVRASEQSTVSDSWHEIWYSRRNVIVTFEGLRRARMHQVGTVIRADGRPGIPWALTGDSVGDNRAGRLLVVDIDDRDLHPQLRRWTRERRDAALDIDWRVIRSSGREYSLVEQFLDSREEVRR